MNRRPTRPCVPTPVIRSGASRLRTAIATACVAAAMPSMVVGQTAGDIAESASVEAASVEPTRQPMPGAAASGAQVFSGAAASNDFYVLAGFVLDRSGETRFTDKDCSSPMHLYGCAMGIDDAPLGSLGDFGTLAGFELGVGYVAAPHLRLEAAVQYRPSFSFEGRAKFSSNHGRTVRLGGTVFADGHPRRLSRPARTRPAPARSLPPVHWGWYWPFPYRYR